MSKKLSIIILAGGEGTRVKTILGDTPKILAPINNKFFIDYLLIWLDSNFKEINYELIIASGYGHNKIQKYCIENNLSINLCREMEPLGTLGAAANASMSSNSNDVLILNGDTIFDCNFPKVFDEFIKLKSTISIVLNRTENDRYGGYTINKDGFLELSKNKPSLISMGATFTKKDLLIDTYKKFKSKKGVFAMMDQDFISKVPAYPYILNKDNSFIDIGTIESFRESQDFVPLFLSKL